MRTKKTIVLTITIFLLVSPLFFSMFMQTDIKLGNNNETKQVDENSNKKDIKTASKQYQDTNNLTYRYVWGEEEALNEEPSPPNIVNILDNVTSFTEENHTVYLGDDEIPEPLMEGTQWTYLQIELLALYVRDDHDSASAGEIYVRWIPNYWIGMPEYDPENNWDNYQWIDGLSVDHDLYNETSQYSISDNPPTWSNFTTPIMLFEGWTVLSCLLLEVMESDFPSADDRVGGFYWNYWHPSTLVGYHEFTSTDVDVAINVTIVDTNNTFTADNLTELYQPFLFDNDDTDHTREPNIVSARVIHGFDPTINRNAFCIQYIYYWTEVWREYSFWTDERIHYDDYEVVQIYLNFSYTGDQTPYRFVFDNQDTYANTPTGWRTDQKYSIYEIGVTNEIISTTVPISQELQPLLGTSYNVSYYKWNLSEYTQELSGCFGGVPSLLLTINTSYHQFAMGRVTSLNYFGKEAEILGQLSTSPFDLIPINTLKIPLTDDTIYNFYARLNKSLTEGFSVFDGEEIPNYAPFTYDVLQVFKEPYIHSSYDYIMQDAIRFKDDTETKGGFIKVQRSVNFTYIIPLKTDIDLPDVLAPGQNLTTVLGTILDESNAILMIDYYFKITANYSLFFTEKYFESVIENRIVIDFSNPQVQLFNKFLDFCFNRTFSKDIGDYVTIDVLFTPQLLGEILNCNITVHLIEILKYFFPQFTSMLSLFFEDLYLKINPIISGYLSAKVKLGNSNQTIYWDTETKNFNIDLEIPDLSYGDKLSLEIINFTYGINFFIDWYLGYIPSFILELIIGDGNEYFLGQYPNINFDLASILGNITLKTWDAYTTTWGISPDDGDDLIPIITINSPNEDDVFGANPPTFSISIVESNLDKTWYSLNGGTNITFTGLTGTINQALWDALPEGNVIIRFYANDTFGRIGFQEVTVVKAISQPNPPEIPGYDILLLLGITSTIAIIIVKKRLNHLN